MLIDDYDEAMPQDPIARFEKFFRMYEDKPNDFIYIQKINRMLVEDEISLYVDFEHLSIYSPKLARDLHENPGEYIKKANQAVVNILYTISCGEVKLTDERAVRFFNLPKIYQVHLRKLRVKHLERLISINGMLLRATDIRPEVTIASFECKLCGARHNIEQIDDELTYPNICNVGGCKNTKRNAFRIMAKNCEMIDHQRIRIQEDMHDLVPGTTPRYFDCLLWRDMVDISRPGDRIILTGVLKAIPFQSSGKSTNKIFREIFVVNCIQTKEKMENCLDITEAEMDNFRAFARRENIHNLLANQIAPNIYGWEDLKLATMLSLFKGVSKVSPDGSLVRGNIHVLFMGDPGTGKSQILLSASNLAPRAMYSVAKGVSAAGATAAVIRDEITGQWTLEAGILPMCDGGMACIDELDKMYQKDLPALHEAMAQLTVTISKAGIKAQLRSRTSIIGAANPRAGRWNPDESPSQNINLPPSILSRFDLLFIVRDIPDEKKDSDIVDHILDVHDGKEVNDSLEPLFVRKYIYFANQLEPTLNDEAKKEIKKFYLNLRSGYKDKGSPIPIGARSVEGLIRLSKAYAKMGLKETVTGEHIQAITKLALKSMYQTCWDPHAGKFDVDNIQLGRTKSKFEKSKRVLKVIKDLAGNSLGKPVYTSDIVQACIFEDIEEDEVKKLLELLDDNGEIIETKRGQWMVII